MKENNIVEAVNKVLTKHFGVPCKFQTFYAECEIEKNAEGGVVQGYYSSGIVFYSESHFDFDVVQDVALYSSCAAQMQGKTVYQHACLLLCGSKLRKKLLKAMLKHNGDT